MYDAIRQFSAASGRARGLARRHRGHRTHPARGGAGTINPLFGRPLPDGRLPPKMVLAARLVNADLGLRVIDMGWGDFDSHSGQPSMHPARMAEFDAGLRAFFTNLDDAYRSRVSILFVSEFGRTPWANGSDGTDHGAASFSLLIGRRVGRRAARAATPRSPTRALGPARPHRRLPSGVRQRALDVAGWRPGGGAGGGVRRACRCSPRGPGPELPEAPAPPNLAGDYVALNPFRVLDTRNNIGGRRAPLGAGRHRRDPDGGIGGVPASRGHRSGPQRHRRRTRPQRATSRSGPRARPARWRPASTGGRPDRPEPGRDETGHPAARSTSGPKRARSTPSPTSSATSGTPGQPAAAGEPVPTARHPQRHRRRRRAQGRRRRDDRRSS